MRKSQFVADVVGGAHWGTLIDQLERGGPIRLFGCDCGADC